MLTIKQLNNCGISNTLMSCVLEKQNFLCGGQEVQMCYRRI